MPKNNNLKPVKLPMQIKFNMKPSTKFVNNLDAVELTLIHAPSMDDLRYYVIPFLKATWEESPDLSSSMSIQEKDTIIRECLEGKSLPTALETIELVFLINGISIQEVTHILRYRTASFSADCSGDKWWTEKDALVPSSIINSDGAIASPGYKYKGNFYSRYQIIVQAAKELYCDMIDSKTISIMDARSILPRCLSTFYYMKLSLKDAIAFIKQRIDKQIQPETDNIIAYQMYCSLLQQYPVMNGLIDIHQASQFYINMARTGKATNLYFPDQDSDKFDWNENDFIYQCKRDEMNGNSFSTYNHFTEALEYYDNAIKELERVNTIILNCLYKLKKEK